MDIPQNFSVVLGDETFDVMVLLGSWERMEAGGRGDPPIPPQNGPEGGEVDEEEEDNRQQNETGQANADDDLDDEAGELEEVGSPQQTRTTNEVGVT